MNKILIEKQEADSKITQLKLENSNLKQKIKQLEDNFYEKDKNMKNLHNDELKYLEDMNSHL